MPLRAAELKSLADADDEQLMALFQNENSEAAYTVLVRRYKSPIVNFLYRFVGNYDDALDLAQETFLRLYKYKHTYEPTQRFSTWLYTIATNVARTFYRQRRRLAELPFSSLRRSEEEEEAEWEIPDTSYLPDTRVDSDYIAQRIQQALMQLPPVFREAVILRDIMELSYEEIAEATQTELGTVKSRINRARRRLQELLRDLYEELYGRVPDQP
ncbi:ECF RNA polymerase sigma factor SigE [bacterium HR21]|jgi:RNA polymerase sigma-70 factor (ECF subfamily)|nr:ECF RNA polymerase sigma factor SigE [bacterium HR21]